MGPTDCLGVLRPSQDETVQLIYLRSWLSGMFRQLGLLVPRLQFGLLNQNQV